MQIIIILTYELYYIRTYIRGGKKAGTKLFGYKPLEKRFPPYTYTYTLYIFYPQTIAPYGGKSIYFLTPLRLYIYISACGCVYVCARASVFFFSIYRLQEIESDFVCVHARPLRPIKRNTIFST